MVCDRACGSPVTRTKDLGMCDFVAKTFCKVRQFAIAETTFIETDATYNKSQQQVLLDKIALQMQQAIIC